MNAKMTILGAILYLGQYNAVSADRFEVKQPPPPVIEDGEVIPIPRPKAPLVVIVTEN